MKTTRVSDVGGRYAKGILSAGIFTPEQLRYLDEELEKVVAVIANHDEAIDMIYDEVIKIDGGAVDGLLGVSNSLAYKVHEIEKHLHSSGSWFEAAGTPTAAHLADRIGTAGGGGAFRIDAGSSTWGDWVQVLGADDTPARTGSTHFDPHELIVEDVEKATTYFVQMGRGASGAAALTAGTYTETMYAAANTKSTEIVRIQTGRAPVESLLWVRCMAPGEATAWMDFYLGIHEYPG